MNAKRSRRVRVVIVPLHLDCGLEVSKVRQFRVSHVGANGLERRGDRVARTVVRDGSKPMLRGQLA